MDKSDVGLEYGHVERFQCMISSGVTASVNPYLKKKYKQFVKNFFFFLRFSDIIAVAFLAANNQNTFTRVWFGQVLHW